MLSAAGRAGTPGSSGIVAEVVTCDWAACSPPVEQALVVLMRPAPVIAPGEGAVAASVVADMTALRDRPSSPELERVFGRTLIADLDHVSGATILPYATRRHARVHMQPGLLLGS